MASDQNAQFLQLQKDVDELMKWKEAREAQIIQNPLDSNSQQIVYQDVLIFKRFAPENAPVANRLATIEINGQDYKFLVL